MSTSSDKQDPVVAARELLRQIPQAEYVVPEQGAAEHWHSLILRIEFVVGSLFRVQVVPYEVGHVPTAKAFAAMPATLRSLCNELETLSSQHSVQADSIKALHEQEKVYRAAIETAIDLLDKADYGLDVFALSPSVKRADQLLRAAITPKDQIQ